MSTDKVYESLLVQGEIEDTVNVAPAAPVVTHNVGAFEARRLQLLAAKRQQAADWK